MVGQGYWQLELGSAIANNTHQLLRVCIVVLDIVTARFWLLASVWLLIQRQLPNSKIGRFRVAKVHFAVDKGVQVI